MSQETYLEEAHQRYNELMAQAMRTQMSRRLFMKASTLAAMGGAAAVNGLLAACGGGEEQKLLKEATGGEYSRWPLLDKYHYKRLSWGGTPYVDGLFVRSGSGWTSYDVVNRVQSSGGFIWQILMHLRYGAGVDPAIVEMAPDLADKASHAPDYSYYDYHIHQQSYFHNVPPVNGRRVTAEDVRYSLDTYMTTGVYPATLAFIDRVEVLPDKETVRVYPKRPVLFVNELLGSNNAWIFAKEHYEGDKKRWEQQPIGSGPFMVTKTEYRVGIQTVRNPGYGLTDERWKGYKLPFLRGVDWVYIADYAASKSAFRSSQIDALDLSSGNYSDFLDMLATNPNSRIQVQAPNSPYPPGYWCLDNRKKPFSDVRVRRAMSLALDRQAMADTVYGGMAGPQHGISYHLLGRREPFTWEELGPWMQYNPQKARELLTEAGYPNGFSMEFLTTSPVSDDGLLTAKFLEDVGIKVRFNTQESAVVAQARVDRKYGDAILGPYPSGQSGVKVARELYLPDAPTNVSWVNDPVLTDLIEKATYTVDPDEQLKLLFAIHERTLDQCYNLERITAFNSTFWQPWFHNVANVVSGWFC